LLTCGFQFFGEHGKLALVFVTSGRHLILPVTRADNESHLPAYGYNKQ